MTHQEIAEGFETVYTRSKEVMRVENAWIDSERERLRRECGAIGHIWGSSRFAGRMVCLVCNTPKPE